jgi:hypothetical protein
MENGNEGQKKKKGKLKNLLFKKSAKVGKQANMFDPCSEKVPRYVEELIGILERDGTE